MTIHFYLTDWQLFWCVIIASGLVLTGFRWLSRVFMLCMYETYKKGREDEREGKE